MIKIKYIFLRILIKIFSCFPEKAKIPSVTEIDVIIPVIRKDLSILPLCLKGIKNCVVHPIANIYIVAPADDQIVKFCYENSLIYVEETSVLGYDSHRLNIINPVTGTNRNGWLYQQLIKLSGNIGTCKYFLCIDADHVLLTPHVFIEKDETPVFYTSSEFHQDYYQNIKKLMNGQVTTTALFSYIAHKMIFNKETLNNLRNDIARLNSSEWDMAILNSLDLNKDSGFSEFELYGNYYKTRKQHSYWKNLNLTYKHIATYEKLQSKFSNKYKSVTFSAWMN